jgi:hypothetical protein
MKSDLIHVLSISIFQLSPRRILSSSKITDVLIKLAYYVIIQLTYLSGAKFE